MSQNAVSHKRIAKNTLALYIRGIISAVIGLYTSRVVIDILGVDDYGVYGVAGGFVAMLSFLNASMSGATSRFITYEMGLGEEERIKKTFANALTVHILIAVIIFIVCEAVGVWFLNTQLNIPPDRMTAANVLFQLSVFSACIQITQVPYTALIISHERMGIYAYMEIANVALKLIIVYFLLILPGDKLIIYGILTALISFVIAMAYRLYCLRKFTESRTHPKYDKAFLKPILSFSGWDMYGNLCVAARTQGNSYLLNIFFGVAINGAAQISGTINGQITAFSNNIITAIRPQIIKSYAQKSWHEFQHLIELACQLSTLLLSIMAIPLIIETQYVFELWLNEVPEWVVIFSRITIFTAIIGQINLCMGIGIHATGNIKSISFLSGTLYLLTLPAIYIYLKLGYPPSTPFIIMMVFLTITTVVNIIILKRQAPQFNMWRAIYKIAVLPLMCIPAFVACYCIHRSLDASFLRFVTVCLTSIVLIGIPTYIFVPTPEHKKQINGKIKHILHIR